MGHGIRKLKVSSVMNVAPMVRYGHTWLSMRALSSTKRSPSSTEALSSNSKIQGLVISLEVLIGTEEREIFKAALERRRVKAKEEKKRERVYDTSNEIVGIHSLQTKYMEKIKQKLGKADAKPFKRGKGDSALLQVGKDMENRILAQTEDGKVTKQGASAAWLLQLGMGNLLDYFISRSVSIGKCSSIKIRDKGQTEKREEAGNKKLK